MSILRLGAARVNANGKSLESCVERLHKQLAEMTTRAKEAEDQVEYLKEYKVKYERSIDDLKVE